MVARDGMDKGFGVVLFDDEEEPGAGWAHLYGQKGGAHRISGPADLGTGAIWWSNISYEFFFRKNESWRNSWLRHDKYLVISHMDALREWGYDPKQTDTSDDPAWQCAFLSSVFYRIMTLSYMLAREVDPEISMSKLFVGKTLRNDLKIVMPEPLYPKGEAAAIMKTGQAFDEFTVTSERSLRDSTTFVLRKPRVLYTMEMLQTPVPDFEMPMDFLSRKQLREMNPDRVALLRDIGRPAMIELSVERMDGDLASIYGFGNSTNKEKRSQRSWVSYPEFLALSRYAELDVRNCWVGQETSTFMEHLRDPVKEFLTYKYNELSWSAGIVAETLWRATSLGEANSGPLRTGEERAHTSWQGAWIKGADKVSMFASAFQLTQAGYTVKSYGLGWVRISIPEDSIKDLIHDGLSFGLVPNMCEVPQGMFDINQQIQWGGDQKSYTLAHCQVTGDQDFAWNLDRIPLIATKHRKKFLAQLVTNRQKALKGR
ncbi:hypothetical protein [Roseibium sp. RKSG952]|uniref:hypothetical protein n=1 Tax=Roseibium sp. RKSG952 TaxID=2529384 RepID=UPI0012BD68E6|nr:hypothetical protein [Roseibium sp. RKSG952]MTH96632.1 hypothetical protein [Roseibium sp. RKSG952]